MDPPCSRIAPDDSLETDFGRAILGELFAEDPENVSYLMTNIKTVDREGHGSSLYPIE